MPQPKKGARLGSNPAHQRLMLSNLAVSLFAHEKIRTTEAKAKALRPFAEKLITKAKKGDLHNRRQVLSTIEDRDIVHKLFEDIAPRFAERNGGYTRILKIGPRNGDGAPMVLIELVEESTSVATTVETPEGRKRRLTRPAGRRRKDEESTPGDAAAEGSDAAEAEAELELEGDEATAAPEAAGDADAKAEAEAESEPDADDGEETEQPAAEANAEASDATAEDDQDQK